MDNKWYQWELDTLHKLRTRLNLNTIVMRQLVRELNDMKRAMTQECSTIEMVILQARRDKTLQPYLKAYSTMGV